MNSHPHRTNSDFQLRYFLVGSCHTPDGAWSLLYGQKVDMEIKVRACEAQRLRREAAVAKAGAVLSRNDTAEFEKLDAQAELAEISATLPVWEMNFQAAKDELATIEKLMSELEPHRKYAHLPILEAHEAAQREEWLGELKRRVENFIVSQGTIPADELDTMRCHPDFATELVPHIRQLGEKLKSAQDGLEVLTQNKVPLLLGKSAGG